MASDFIFSCKTESKKIISIKKDGNYVIYLYGKDIKNPEIKIRNEIKKIDIELSKPTGYEIVTNIPIKNGAYTYSVFTNTDTLNEAHKSTSGVAVFKDEKYIFTIRCLTTKGNLLDIDSAG